MKKKLFRERWYGTKEEKKDEAKAEEKKPAKKGKKKND